MSIADLATTCFAVQLLVGAILLIGEATGRLRLPYGKFRTGAGVNSRAGLALAYATPVFVYIVLWVEGGSPRTLYHLGCVDGFDQDEAESKRDERAVILRRLLASKCDTLEAFELADSLFNACPCLVECFRKEGGHILGVGSIRDCRTYSALARGVAV